MLNMPNINKQKYKKYISLPYENVNFLIPEEFVSGTIACHKFDLNLTNWNWDKKNKVSYLSKEIPYLPFDLVADLFAIKQEETFGLRNKNISPKKVIYTYVKTVIILAGEENSLVTSMDCCVVDEENCDFKPLKGIPKKLLQCLGVENCCFIENRFGIVINPLEFLNNLESSVRGQNL